ncbi:MAG: NAD(+)/NADH kinase, partial [Dissulfuribacterales bacterium]
MLKHISLIIRHETEVPNRIGKVIKKLFHGYGVSVTEGKVNPQTDAIVVLGGDGTLLHVAGKAYQLGIPLLGINLGGLGFLTEIHINEMEQALDSLISGTFELDKRTILSVTLKVAGSKDSTYYALNEAVISKGPLSTIITLPTWAGGSFLTTYRGDGLIISSATGSTAYNLSAGGPILHPCIEALILTPICPFALNARPLILPGRMKVAIQLRNAREKISLVIDGQAGYEINEGDCVEVQKAQGHLKLIKSPIRNYFTILNGNARDRREVLLRDPEHLDPGIAAVGTCHHLA